MSNKILFLGYGYVAQYFCSYFDIKRDNVLVTINKTKDLYFVPKAEVVQIGFQDLTQQILDKYDSFVISIPPFYEDGSDAVIDNFYNYFLTRTLPYRLIYLSATSVYGDHGGRKVNEDSELKAESINGQARIACEQKYMALMQNICAEIVILRLAAIYGSKRNNIAAIKSGELTESSLSNRVISRTHVQDICEIIRQVITVDGAKNQIFNVCDDEPCASFLVNDFICEHLLNIAKLPRLKHGSSSIRSSFSLDNKIIDNTKLKSLFKYQFIYPSYQDGLAAIFTKDFA